MYQNNQGGFNPQQSQWEAPQNQNAEGFQEQLMEADPALIFFMKHPHFIEFLMKQISILVVTIQTPIFRCLEVLMKSTNMQPPEAAAATSLEGEMKNFDPIKIVESLNLDSEAFIALLTEHQLSELQTIHQNNHQAAVNNGYAHYDSNQQAHVSAWGVSYPDPNGQNGMGFQTHQSDPYHQSQQYYPNEPPGGYNPYQQPSMTGALLGMGMNYMIGQQQQPRY